MARDRLSLHDEFIDILGTRGQKVSRVYFQPPESLKMEYECIRYSRTGVNVTRANNGVYVTANKYEVIVIDYDPDSKIPDKILERFPMCTFDRVYVSDNLYHTALTLYY